VEFAKNSDEGKGRRIEETYEEASGRFRLNAVTVGDSYPLPLISEILDALRKSSLLYYSRPVQRVSRSSSEGSGVSKNTVHYSERSS
jgi:hypothetical protein